MSVGQLEVRTMGVGDPQIGETKSFAGLLVTNGSSADPKLFAQLSFNSMHKLADSKSNSMVVELSPIDVVVLTERG